MCIGVRRHGVTSVNLGQSTVVSVQGWVAPSPTAVYYVGSCIFSLRIQSCLLGFLVWAAGRSPEVTSGSASEPLKILAARWSRDRSRDPTARSVEDDRS